MRDGYCWLCGRWGHLEEHHIFGGAYRKKSTKYGLTVFLCGGPLPPQRSPGSTQLPGDGSAPPRIRAEEIHAGAERHHRGLPP